MLSLSAELLAVQSVNNDDLGPSAVKTTVENLGNGMLVMKMRNIEGSNFL